MKKLNSLAKILFFFFAVLSFSLVIVSCNDDDEKDAKTTTSTTEEEDDEDLDSIPIEEMTLEQRRKVFIGTWVQYDWLSYNGPDTLTFLKDGSVNESNSIFQDAYFTLTDTNKIKFDSVTDYPNQPIKKKEFYFELKRYDGVYWVQFRNFEIGTWIDAIYDIWYYKID